MQKFRRDFKGTIMRVPWGLEPFWNKVTLRSVHLGIVPRTAKAGNPCSAVFIQDESFRIHDRRGISSNTVALLSMWTCLRGASIVSTACVALSIKHL